ncbi:MAG: RlmE family RNA methyltransferase [Deltaproteobacteria bacterium]|nr:RlmE family RNA methyltransferase [Deltaproteobacteria bacterium]
MIKITAIKAPHILTMKKNRWDDHYTRRARKEKWLARSVYKLQEIDGRFSLIRRGDRVLDLGCYPGSWSQYALQRVGDQGDVVGVDLRRPVHLQIRGFRFIEGDVLSLATEWLGREIWPRDLVLSDLAPSTTGIGDVDTSRSLRLAEKALEIACLVLRKRGGFVCKVLEGGGLKGFRREVSQRFSQVSLFRPGATRKRSREVYVIAQGFGGTDP